MTTRIVQVIYNDEERRGKGTEDDLVRRIPALYTLDGDLICSYDYGPNAMPSSTVRVVNEGALRKLERQS